MWNVGYVFMSGGNSNLYEFLLPFSKILKGSYFFVIYVAGSCGLYVVRI